jgi:hypothetical protein
MALLDTIKDIYDLVKKGATLDLQKQLLNLSQEALELQSENIVLKSQVAELKEALSLKTELKWDGTAYWRNKPDGEKDGPFCQFCFDKEERLVRLIDVSEPDPEYPSTMWYGYKCNVCDKIYVDENRKDIPF